MDSRPYGRARRGRAFLPSADGERQCRRARPRRCCESSASCPDAAREGMPRHRSCMPLRRYTRRAARPRRDVCEPPRQSTRIFIAVSDVRRRPQRVRRPASRNPPTEGAATARSSSPEKRHESAIEEMAAQVRYRSRQKMARRGCRLRVLPNAPASCSRPRSGVPPTQRRVHHRSANVMRQVDGSRRQEARREAPPRAREHPRSAAPRAVCR